MTGHLLFWLRLEAALWIDIRSFETSSEGRHITISYGHINSYLVHDGDFIRRGQPIATLGKTGTQNEPHIHYALGINDDWVDPFRDLSNPTSVNYWTVDNNPQCLP
jgi:murein DD-endopeptidase MepM/ murein hydrolase activator NlpD